MSPCQLYTELAANPDCSLAGVLHDEKLSVKQNKIPAEEPSVKSDIVQSRKQADKRDASSYISIVFVIPITHKMLK